MSSPKLSVLMPVYNAEAYLRESIESILNQSFSDFELLIGEDGSTDNSLKIISSYNDPRIIVFSNSTNKGIVHTCNKLIKESKGELITRQDSDDISLPARFQKQVNFLNKNPQVSLCGTNFTFFGNKNRRMFMPQKDNEIRVFMILNNPFCTSTVMFRKPTPLVYFNENLVVTEDYDLWFELSKTYKMANLSEHLLNYRWHGSNISQVKKDAMVQTANAIRSNILAQTLSLAIDDNETLILNKIEDSTPVSIDDLSILEGFLLRLLRHNREINYYNQTAMEKLFSYLWIKNCLRTKNLSLSKRFQTCLSSSLFCFTNILNHMSLRNIRSLYNNYFRD